MSTKYTGGFITKSPVAPTTSAASGIWTLDQQQQAQKAGTWPSPPNYIEEVFSTYLYTGTGVAQTITNNVDISGKGGFVWIKGRNVAEPHVGVDTARGASNALRQNSDAASINDAGRVSAFTSSGFSVGTDGETNGSGTTYASWTFRKQAKFFDVVTWTGNGANRTIAHNLGSVPGCIIVKRTNTTSNWAVYHRSLTNVQYLDLNNNNDVSNSTFFWNSTTPTSTVFSLGNDDVVNASGSTYVAYVFAHNAGGFGLTGTDNVISCGSVVNTGNPQVTLGYEPQWVLFKTSDSFSSWYIVDNMRGLAVGADQAVLLPNSSAAEVKNSNYININATGFTTNSSLLAGTNIVYIAIRRGPMKTPTVGTSVFNTQTATYSANQVVTTGFPVDMLMMKGRTISFGNLLEDRLRGLASTNTSPVNPQLLTTTPDGETAGDYTNTANNTGYQISPGFSGFLSVNWNFGRAPGFMDVVCYLGTGVQGRTVAHNLIVAPEFIIVKARDKVENFVGWSLYGPTSGSDVLSGNLNDTNLFSYTRIVGTPTTTTFAVSSNGETNAAGYNYVAYLFATLAGVSKVGSYTGTGAAQTINCGFTTGARFVLIKCTSSNATNWNVWDSARGIIPANDPYLSINLAAGEVTGTDYIDTTNVGFDITSTAPAEVNGNGSSFIFLAIA